MEQDPHLPQNSSSLTNKVCASIIHLLFCCLLSVMKEASSREQVDGNVNMKC